MVWTARNKELNWLKEFLKEIANFYEIYKFVVSNSF